MKQVAIIILLSGGLVAAGSAVNAADTPVERANAPSSAIQGIEKKTLEEKFRLALIEEETGQHLDPVIQSYRGIIAELDAQRKMAATAVFHLGECYRKQEKTNDAVIQYERILRDFSDQKPLCDLAHKRLEEAGAGKGVKDGAASLSANKKLDPEQVEMIRQEIALVEKHMASIRAQIQVGRAATSDLYKPQQDLFALKRFLPENAAPDIQKSLIEQQIQITEENLKALKIQIQVGVAPQLSAIPLERDLLGLKRELLSVAPDKKQERAQ